jgi:3-oxoacyl-[acyl-carrier protein] reductase
MGSFEGYRVLVTGASGGLGGAAVRAFAAEGADVVMTYLSGESGAKALAEELAERYGVKVVPVRCDVKDESDCKALIACVRDELGGLDVLVNNAGITRDAPLMLMESSDWHDVISTNLDSIYYCCRHALKMLARSKKASVINMSSVSGREGIAGQCNYSASKAGIMGFTRSLARELGRNKITVNAVAPGFISTAMTDAIPEERREELKAQLALRRFGEPEEVADLILFLASDKARYITGQTIFIDGGF